MTQTSYPITYSTDPGAPASDIDHNMWRDLFAPLGDGIVESYGTATTDGRLTVPSTGNTVTMGPCKIRFRGYELKVTDTGDGGQALAVPEATSSMLPYSIGVLYNPANQSVVDGPLTLVCQVGSPTIPSGGAYLELHQLDRPLGTLAVAVYRDRRRVVASTQYVGDNFPPTGYTFPVGTSIRRGRERWVSVPWPLGSASPTGVALIAENATPAELVTVRPGYAVEGQSPRAQIMGNRCYLEGRIKRSTGAAFNAGQTDNIASVPPPAETVLVAGACQADADSITVRYEITLTGQVNVYVPAAISATWIGLDGISYRIPWLR